MKGQRCAPVADLPGVGQLGNDVQAHGVVRAGTDEAVVVRGPQSAILPYASCVFLVYHTRRELLCTLLCPPGPTRRAPARRASLCAALPASSRPQWRCGENALAPGPSAGAARQEAPAPA